MINFKRRKLRLSAAGFVAALLSGCGSSDEFYRLNAIDAGPGRSSSGLAISVGPVSLPSYIDRAELVFQSAPNQFQIPPGVRWVGSLQENISRVLAADLGRALHSGRVRSSLEPGSAPQYRVAIEIRQFHGISGDQAVLDLSWRIQDGTGQRNISRHNGSYRERIAGDGYKPLVAAESRLLAQCAQAIAASLRAGN
ncbi:MAG: PqiC family protein [Verrucomicrobiota bacterium]|nr:PqiC family protein [Verrucomicrobiota bacterium]